MPSKPTTHRIRTKKEKIQSSLANTGVNRVLGQHMSRQHKWQLRQLINRFGGKCAVCGCNVNLIEEDEHQATRDHIVPLSKGGTDHITNLQLLCRTCNQEKADTTSES